MHELAVAHEDAHVRIARAQGVEEHEVAALQAAAAHGIAELRPLRRGARQAVFGDAAHGPLDQAAAVETRSEEHTSELQSQSNLVCRLLLEKKKNTTKQTSRLDCEASKT